MSRLIASVAMSLLLTACEDDGKCGKVADDIVAECADGFLQHEESESMSVLTCTRASPDPLYSTCTEVWVEQESGCYWLSVKHCHRE